MSAGQNSELTARRRGGGGGRKPGKEPNTETAPKQIASSCASSIHRSMKREYLFLCVWDSAARSLKQRWSLNELRPGRCVHELSAIGLCTRRGDRVVGSMTVRSQLSTLPILRKWRRMSLLGCKYFHLRDRSQCELARARHAGFHKRSEPLVQVILNPGGVRLAILL